MYLDRGLYRREVLGRISCLALAAISQGNRIMKQLNLKACCFAGESGWSRYYCYHQNFRRAEFGFFAVMEQEHV